MKLDLNTRHSFSSPESVNNAEDFQTLTVLMCDLVDSTRLAENLSNQEIRDLLDNYYLICNKRINLNGGRVIRCIGDAVYAIFNTETTTEKCTANAASAAIDLKNDISRTTVRMQKRDISLSSRISISTGAGILSYIPITNQETVYGKLPFIAERLKSCALENEIVVNEECANFLDSKFSLSDALITQPKGMISLCEFRKLNHRNEFLSLRQDLTYGPDVFPHLTQSLR